MVLINTRLDIDNSRSYYLLDYFIPSKSLCIELDSDYHDPIRDNLKDQFLNSLGIEVLRVKDFDNNTKFKLDKIVEWIKFKPVKEFKIDYSELINKCKIYLTDIGNLEISRGDLYFIKNKWYNPIKKLCEYDSNLEVSIVLNTPYKLSISLDDIFDLIPRYKKKRSKNILISY